jgi:ribonuclease P protein component
VIGRIVRSSDFERVLRTPPRARSAHFAIHHLADHPTRPGRPVGTKLSTDGAPHRTKPVDDCSQPVSGLWVGTVVPKRHARRSVTRVLIKRQIRKSFGAHEGGLAAGLWVVRLRAPFEGTVFHSAASRVLWHAAGVELDAVLAEAVGRSQAR